MTPPRRPGHISGASSFRVSGSRVAMSERAGSLASLACLILLVIGVPLLLISERAGLPLGLVTDAIGHPSLLLHAFGRPVTDNTIVDGVVITAWLACAGLRLS